MECCDELWQRVEDISNSLADLRAQVAEIASSGREETDTPNLRGTAAALFAATAGAISPLLGIPVAFLAQLWADNPGLDGWATSLGTLLAFLARAETLYSTEPFITFDLKDLPFSTYLPSSIDEPYAEIPEDFLPNLPIEFRQGAWQAMQGRIIVPSINPNDPRIFDFSPYFPGLGSEFSGIPPLGVDDSPVPEEVETQLGVFEEQITQLQHDDVNASKEIQGLQADASIHKEKVVSLETRLELAFSQIGALQTKIDTLNRAAKHNL